MLRSRALLAGSVLLCAILVVVGLQRTGPGDAGLEARRAESAPAPGRVAAAGLETVPVPPEQAPTVLERSTPAMGDKVAPVDLDPENVARRDFVFDATTAEQSETVTVRLIVPDWTTDEQRAALRSSNLKVQSMLKRGPGLLDFVKRPTTGFDEDLCSLVRLPYRGGQLDVTQPKIPRDPAPSDDAATMPAPSLPRLIVDTRVVGTLGERVLEVELAPVPVWHLRFEGPDGRAPEGLTVEMTDTLELLSPLPDTGLGYVVLPVRGLEYAGRSLAVRTAGYEPLVVQIPAEGHRTGLPLVLGTFKLRASIELAGQLVDQEGRPAANFQVRMSETFPGMVGAAGTATTDAEGRFVLGPPSDASVVVFGLGSVRGVPHFFGPVDVGKSRSPMRATVVPAPTATLVLRHDAPAQGELANIAITSMDDATGGTRKTAKRVKDGEIALGGFFPGRWHIQVQRGETSGEIVIDATEGHRDVELRLAR